MRGGRPGLLFSAPGVEVASATPWRLNVAGTKTSHNQALIPVTVKNHTHPLQKRTHGCPQQTQLQREQRKDVALGSGSAPAVSHHIMVQLRG